MCVSGFCSSCFFSYCLFVLHLLLAIAIVYHSSPCVVPVCCGALPSTCFVVVVYCDSLSLVLCCYYLLWWVALPCIVVACCDSLFFTLRYYFVAPCLLQVLTSPSLMLLLLWFVTPYLALMLLACWGDILPPFLPCVGSRIRSARSHLKRIM